MHQNYGFDKFINRAELRNTVKYVVKQGDSLYKIASMFNTTVSDIVSVNNLTSTMIYPNQILFIPQTSGYTNIYKNETLTLKEFLLSKNINIEGLSNDTLNSLIRVSKDNKEDGVYIIDNKDTLDIILEKSGLTPYQLLDLNINKWLNSGEKIIIK